MAARASKPMFKVFVDTDSQPPASTSTAPTRRVRSSIADKENILIARSSPPRQKMLKPRARPVQWNGKEPFGAASPETCKPLRSSALPKHGAAKRTTMAPLRANTIGRKEGRTVSADLKGKGIERIEPDLLPEVEAEEGVQEEVDGALANVTEAYVGSGGFHYSPRAPAQPCHTASPSTAPRSPTPPAYRGLGIDLHSLQLV